jgi:hypothetical protein
MSLLVQIYKQLTPYHYSGGDKDKDKVQIEMVPTSVLRLPSPIN